MRATWCILVLLMAAALVNCGGYDEDYTAQTENCIAVADVTGETYTLCCRVSCTAEYDYDDYNERCTEETTCTVATGAACPLRVLLETRYPACVY